VVTVNVQDELEPGLEIIKPRGVVMTREHCVKLCWSPGRSDGMDEIILKELATPVATVSVSCACRDQALAWQVAEAASAQETAERPEGMCVLGCRFSTSLPRAHGFDTQGT